MKKLKFKTELPLSTFRDKISHKDKLLLIGSCFSRDIGNKLRENKFHAFVNPFGILYDPLSISRNLTLAIANRAADAEGVIENSGRFYHLDFHSDISGKSEEECLQHADKAVSICRSALEELDFMFLTLGTSWIYRRNDSGKAIANCHKLPAKEFSKELLSVQDMELSLAGMLEKLLLTNPKVKVVFTISPVRHLKDGMHENQLSKAALMLAVDSVVKKFDHCMYFPSYEIMMDELRDYRFYKEDLLHPSTLAIDYIWRYFSESFFSIASFQLLEEIQQIASDVAHKPFHPESDAHKKFLQNLEGRILRFSKKHNLDYREELEKLKSWS